MTLEGLWMLILLTLGLLGACIYLGLLILVRNLRERWRMACNWKRSMTSERLHRLGASAGAYPSERDNPRQ